MQKLKSAWDFFQSHKAKWGAVLIGAGSWVATLDPKYAHYSQVLLAVGGLLAGGGVLPSDSSVKAKKEWEESGVDRRQP